MIVRGRLVLLIVAGLVPVAAADVAPRMPGPATARYVRGTREADDAACTKCHAGIASEHAGSLHARAFSDPSFQKGYIAESSAFCRSCHAPEALPAATPDAFAEQKGVTCVTCHRPDPNGAILASFRVAPSTDAPHAVTRVQDFGTRACVGCHDFAFPGAEAKGERGRMQKTALEHARSGSDKTCAQCHMPKSHAFRASRDSGLLSAALDVKAARTADGEAEFVIGSKNVGHAFPTGDLFRRLVLRVDGPRGQTERALERAFRAERDEATGTYVRYESFDNRPAPARRLVLPITGELAWEVAYQRVTGVGQTPPFTVDVEAELVLARGRLP